MQKRIQAANRFLPALPEGYASLSQLAIAFPLSNPVVSTVLVGCKTVAQVESNFAPANLPSLTPQQVDAIRDIQGAIY